jgi:alanyl-tRNA synthetase
MNVGRTPRHHTFFEMLGNFSFNAYFKAETIAWAWEFLTEVLGLDQTRLYITVNERDDDAWRIWEEEIGIPTERMCRLGDDDNFWPASAPTEGPLGPGGNCSEIFWDYTPEVGGGANPGNDDSDRFVEIWNLVFPEFNVVEPKVDGRYTLEELGRRNIDTGSGLERLACVIQGKRNNFDIDLLQTIVQKVVAVAGVAYQEGDPEGSAETNVLLRRVADHVRAVTFCIADGALPQNTGRGYIVRRLIRRATLDIDKLGVSESRLWEIVAAVVEAMGDAYPEVARRKELAEQLLESEERNFRRTLRRGLELFGRALERHRSENATVFSGDDAFELFTTYGFPKEITEELAEDEGLPVDEARFEERMAEFAVVSTGGREIEVFQASAIRDAKPRLGATPFVGYDAAAASAGVPVTITLIDLAGDEVDRASEGAQVRIALDQTPFYAEGGGQVGDSGVLNGDGFVVRITDTQKDEGLFIHEGVVESGVAVLGPVTAVVEADPRAAVTRHHSATHLLHAALTEVLGDHVEQQGSKVEAGGLRFDFNHPKALKAAELATLEERVNAQVSAAHAVLTEELPIDEAKARGAKAQFGEKYGDTVRVVSMGAGDALASIELCGGCHVTNTGDIAAFRIVREEATAAGIRRIQAVAGTVAQELDAKEAALAVRLAELVGLPEASADRRELGPLAQGLKVTTEDLPVRVGQQLEHVRTLAEEAGEEPRFAGATLTERIAGLADESKRLRKLIEQAAAAKAVAGIDSLLASPQDVAGLPVFVQAMDGVDGKALRQVVDRVKQQVDSYLLVLGSRAGGKALLVVAASPDVVARGVKAGGLVSKLAPLVGGGGGGKPDLAQAGGKKPEQLDDALAALPGLVEELVGAGSA